MKKYMILFVAVFICVFCNKISEDDQTICGDIITGECEYYEYFGDVRKQYYQILLKKWQKRLFNGRRRI
jgi:hypothetical protein